MVRPLSKNVPKDSSGSEQGSEQEGEKEEEDDDDSAGEVSVAEAKNTLPPVKHLVVEVELKQSLPLYTLLQGQFASTMEEYGKNKALLARMSQSEVRPCRARDV